MSLNTDIATSRKPLGWTPSLLDTNVFYKCPHRPSTAQEKAKYGLLYVFRQAVIKTHFLRHWYIVGWARSAPSWGTWWSSGPQHHVGHAGTDGHDLGNLVSSRWSPFSASFLFLRDRDRCRGTISNRWVIDIKKNPNYLCSHWIIVPELSLLHTVPNPHIRTGRITGTFTQISHWY